MTASFDAQWIKIRGWISLMGRGEEISSGRQVSKIECDREVGMKSLDLSDCTPLRFL